MTDCGALETLLSKDFMIGVLERIRDIFIQETAKLRRRRNQEHSSLCKLPQELLVEILLLSVDWKFWSVDSLHTLARVSTSWRDTILSCNRFWSVIDVAASPAAREVTMKRSGEGAVDLRCGRYLGPSRVSSFVHDVKSVTPIRARSVLYEIRPGTSSFMDHLRSNNSTIIDLLLSNLGVGPSEAHLELSAEGSNLRHLDLSGASLQWQSPRLAKLRTLCLRDLKYNIPPVNHLYNILSSSPQLERLCLMNIVSLYEPGLGSLPTSAPPINLPALKTLAFDCVPTPILTSILPRIRALACHTITVHEEELPVFLELQETTIELIAKPINLSNVLKLKLEVDDGTCLHIRSEPVVAKEFVYWARDQPGVDIKLAIPSTEVLPQFWGVLGNALRSHGGAPNITSLEVEWTGQEFLFPFTVLKFPFPFTVLEHFPVLTSLRFIDYPGTTLHPLIQFLGGNRTGGSGVAFEHRFPLPSLNSLSFYAKTIPNLKDCVSSTKTLLERRYPVSGDGVFTGDAQVLNDLCLPNPLVHALQQRGVATSLDFKKVIRGTEVGG
ncbi:hypothetical protein M407DRAFT_22753 [Tulasnella calospora MUT 4182]|uniref:F-box domain-containing protein n=1 Tax=Tulasnella calospora MUT 4182 TaxID=1051891 RepID=A0A0C3QBR0_9AGAM|nr:hypothetical protein M407DRAFT_22753 [Tulasnella calospora MUT 4182]